MNANSGRPFATSTRVGASPHAVLIFRESEQFGSEWMLFAENEFTVNTFEPVNGMTLSTATGDDLIAMHHANAWFEHAKEHGAMGDDCLPAYVVAVYSYAI